MLSFTSTRVDLTPTFLCLDVRMPCVAGESVSVYSSNGLLYTCSVTSRNVSTVYWKTRCSVDVSLLQGCLILGIRFKLVYALPNRNYTIEFTARCHGKHGER